MIPAILGENPKICFVQKRFLGLAQIKESFEIVLAAASLEFNVSLLFMDDGVFQLAGSKESDLSAFLMALPVCGIEKMYVAQESLNHRQLLPHDLVLPATCLSPNEMTQLFIDHDVVF